MFNNTEMDLTGFLGVSVSEKDISATDAYFISHMARIGDRVMLKMSDEHRLYSSIEVSNGSLGWVVGYTQYTCSYGYNDRCKPGVYRGNGNVLVMWDKLKSGIISENKITMISAHDIIPIGISVKQMTDRRKDDAYNKMFDEEVWIGTLPECKYYPGDVVRLANELKRKAYGAVVKILNINYNNIEMMLNDNETHYPYITIECEGGGTTNISDADIEDVVSRGNYYWWEHDKSQLKFDTLKDETAFYYSKGFLTYARNPRTNTYSYTLQEAVEAIREGLADGVKVSQGYFEAGLTTSAMIVSDELPDLKQRVRQASLEGFKDVD